MLTATPVLVSIAVVTVQVEAPEAAVRIPGRGHQARPTADIVELTVDSVEVTDKLNSGTFTLIFHVVSWYAIPYFL